MTEAASNATDDCDKRVDDGGHTALPSNDEPATTSEAMYGGGSLPITGSSNTALASDEGPDRSNWTDAGADPDTDVSTEPRDPNIQLSTVSRPEARPVNLPLDHSVIRLIEQADRSAGKLVNLLAKHFTCFRDETRLDGKKVRLLKRAQIFVADLWAAFGGTGYGCFDDIDCLTMFAGEIRQCNA